MKLNKKKKGFTLIELMAVIAIVAILAAVLVPTVSGYITRAKKTAIITQVRNAVNAVEIYCSTAPTTEVTAVKSKTLGQLIKQDPQPADSSTAFINQDLLSGDDVDKLNLSISYSALSKINQDSNAMNNLYKDGDKFKYETDKAVTGEGGAITTPAVIVQVER